MGQLPGFCGPSYQSTSPVVDAEECINFYPELIETGQGKNSYALYGTPGSKIFAALGNPETSVPGFKFCPTVNRLFAAGNNLYEIVANGTVVPRGALTIPTGPVFMISNQTQLLICSAGKLWVFTFATNVLLPIDGAGGHPSPPFPVTTGIGFSDGFAVAFQALPADLALSSIGDFTTWNALNTSAISLFPDNIVSMIVDHRELCLFGQTKSVVYANAGAAIFPFQPVPGAFAEYGADSLAGQVQLDNSVMWTSFDDRGNLVAYRSSGYNGVRISNHAVEQQWQSYSKTSDLISYAYQMNGHPWWHLYFPTANVSWNYDVATGMWLKQLGWSNGIYIAHRSQNHVFAFGKHLVGDWMSGTIYQLSMPVLTNGAWSFCDDAGQPIRRERITPYIQVEGQRLFHNRIQFDLASGLGPIPPLTDGQGNPRDPQMILSWTNDNSRTWGNDHILNCGQAGKYKTRVFKNRLGSSLLGRAYRIVCSDPIPWQFANAYLDATLGDGGPAWKPTQRLKDRIASAA